MDRLDIVFGSTGSTVGIVKFMERVDRRIEEERDKMLDEDDIDSDSDDELEGPVISVQVKNNVESIPEEVRSTHFLAIKIEEPEIIENVVKVQKNIVDREEVLQECCMKRGLLHVTLAMLRIRGEEGAAEAKQIVRSLEAKLSKVVADKEQSKLRVENLNNFGQRVVYAEVTPIDNSSFNLFVKKVRDAVASASENVVLTNSFDFIPHLTLAKVSRPIARLRRSKYIDSSYYEEFTNMKFGEQSLNNLQLCVIDSATRYDGFYNTLAELKL